MDLIAQAALAHIETVLSGYLPAVSASSLNRDLLVLPRRIKPLGIGNYVGPEEASGADLQGRLVEAEAEIRVSANNQNLGNINSEIQGVTSSLLTTDRETLRSDGIFTLELSSLSPPDTANRNTRVALFRVRYEYFQPPAESSGLIDHIVLRDLLNPADGEARFVANLHGPSLAQLAAPLQDFVALTDPDINASSPAANWQFNATEQRIEQLHNVRGGGLTNAAPRKAGAQLLIRPGGVATPVRNSVLVLQLESASPDGIGCVLRWQDSENFYYFLISQRHDYQVFGKKVAGNWSFLEEDGVGDVTGIDLSTPQTLKVVALASEFSAYLNDSLVCRGRDRSIGTAGDAGLLTHGNNGGRCYAVDLVELMDH